MDINEAEKVIQAQAEVFEKEFDYLKSIFKKDSELRTSQ
jgi:hypothetical protein